MSSQSLNSAYPSVAVCDPLPATPLTSTPGEYTRLIQRMQSMYQAAHQAEYLHLQAEMDLLVQQLQRLKQQRQTAVQ